MSLFVDVAALRRLWWAVSALCLTAGVRFRWMVLMVTVTCELSYYAIKYSAPVGTGPYLSTDLFSPPVYTVPSSDLGVNLVGGTATLTLLVAGALAAVCALTGSSKPLVALELAVAAQAAAAAFFVSFGSAFYWKFHYCLAANMRTEDWFASAAEAVGIVYPRHLKPTDRVLVVGCGTSGIVDLLARHCAEVTAVDISATALRVSQRRSSASNVRWVQADVRDMRALFSDECFDLVVDKGTFAALECVSVEEAALGFGEAERVLRRGGSLVTFLLGFPEPGLLEQLYTKAKLNFEVLARYDVGESAGASAMAFALRKTERGYATATARNADGSLSWYRHGDCYDAQ